MGLITLSNKHRLKPNPINLLVGLEPKAIRLLIGSRNVSRFTKGIATPNRVPQMIIN